MTSPRLFSPLRIRQPAGWLVLAAVLLAGCAGKPVKLPEPLPPVLPPEFIATHQAVLRCPDLAAVSVQLNDHALRIDGVRAPRDLPQVPAPSGLKFAADGFEVSFNQDSALLQQAGESVPRECRLYPVADDWAGAALRDVSLRAVGSAPAWMLEVVPDKWIALRQEGVADRVVLPPVAPVSEGDARRFHVERGGVVLDVLATPQACHDAASGLSFGTTVTVTLGARTLEGCGRWYGKP